MVICSFFLSMVHSNKPDIYFMIQIFLSEYTVPQDINLNRKAMFPASGGKA